MFTLHEYAEAQWSDNTHATAAWPNRYFWRLRSISLSLKNIRDLSRAQYLLIVTMDVLRSGTLHKEVASQILYETRHMRYVLT
jgi:hypothetical protein